MPLTRRDEDHGRKWEQARERQQTCGESGGRWVRSQATLGRMRDMCFTIWGWGPWNWGLRLTKEELRPGRDAVGAADASSSVPVRDSLSEGRIVQSHLLTGILFLSAECENGMRFLCCKRRRISHSFLPQCLFSPLSLVTNFVLLASPLPKPLLCPLPLT